MLISSREAAQILASRGLTRDRARRLLRAGFAGEGLRTRGSLLYEEARVRALVEWPIVDPSVLHRVARSGIFVARVMDLGPDPIAEKTWQFSPYARMRIRLAIETQGYLPFVATVSGFVASGANITAVWPGASGSSGGSTLELDDPGEWFEKFRSRRLVTGPGSAWLLWRPRLAPPQDGTPQGGTL